MLSCNYGEGEGTHVKKKAKIMQQQWVESGKEKSEKSTPQYCLVKSLSLKTEVCTFSQSQIHSKNFENWKIRVGA